jgi:hypothetical protein
MRRRQRPGGIEAPPVLTALGRALLPGASMGRWSVVFEDHWERKISDCQFCSRLLLIVWVLRAELSATDRLEGIVCAGIPPRAP